MAKVVLPFQEQILQAMQIAEKTVDGAEYLVAKFNQIADKLKFKPNDPTIQVVQKTKEDFENDFLRLVTLKYTRTDDAWSGKNIRKSDYLNMQQNLAKSAAEKLTAQGISDGVRLDIGIKNSSQLLRAYSENGKTLDPEMVKILDDISNALLAKHGKINEDGTTYEADIHGKIKEDARGKIKSDPQEVRQLIVDSTNGIAKFHEDLGLLSPTVILRTLPEEQAPSIPAPVKAEPAVPARAPEAPVPAEAPAIQGPGGGAGSKA